MFDDLDDSSQGEPEDSPSDNPHDAENDNSRADNSPSPGTQTTVDEALIEQALDDSAHADAPSSEDSPDSPQETHKSAAQTEQIPVDITRADAYRIHAHRSEDYEARIRKIQEGPLRTPTPEVPPLPGTKYVNPWS